MLESLKQQVYEANLKLIHHGLVTETFGNASGIDRGQGLVVIKPSGVPFDAMRPQDLPVVALDTGKVVEGNLRPSSDTPTHLELYRGFAAAGGVVHTHSIYATAWAQTRRDMPAFGTTHADYFHGDVPCTRPMTPAEIQGEYEANTGKVIVERFAKINPMHMPAVLVANHGPFTWGISADDAVHNAVILEYLARLASETVRIAPDAQRIQPELLDKHFLRKHGPGAYYGQQSK
jgi:L-ribulose-5-phosphate 4-epimerase